MESNSGHRGLSFGYSHLFESPSPENNLLAWQDLTSVAGSEPSTSLTTTALNQGLRVTRLPRQPLSRQFSPISFQSPHRCRQSSSSIQKIVFPQFVPSTDGRAFSFSLVHRSRKGPDDGETEKSLSPSDLLAIVVKVPLHDFLLLLLFV